MKGRWWNCTKLLTVFCPNSTWVDRNWIPIVKTGAIGLNGWANKAVLDYIHYSAQSDATQTGWKRVVCWECARYLNSSAVCQLKQQEIISHRNRREYGLVTTNKAPGLLKKLESTQTAFRMKRNIFPFYDQVIQNHFIISCPAKFWKFS